MGIVYFFGGKLYDALDAHFEKMRYQKIRSALWPSLTGSILDAGCGTGRNFHYFSSKAKVIGVDTSQTMLAIARQRAAESKASISVQEMDLKRLHFRSNTFDAVVATYVLCVMPKRDERAALKELVRVAKPGARLYFLEYVYSKKKFRSMLMKTTAIVPRLLYGLRFNATLPLILEERSVRVEKLQFVYDDVVRLIVVKKMRSLASTAHA